MLIMLYGSSNDSNIVVFGRWVFNPIKSPFDSRLFKDFPAYASSCPTRLNSSPYYTLNSDFISVFKRNTFCRPKVSSYWWYTDTLQEIQSLDKFSIFLGSAFSRVWSLLNCCDMNDHWTIHYYNMLDSWNPTKPSKHLKPNWGASNLFSVNIYLPTHTIPLGNPDSSVQSAWPFWHFGWIWTFVMALYMAMAPNHFSSNLPTRLFKHIHFLNGDAFFRRLVIMDPHIPLSINVLNFRMTSYEPVSSIHVWHGQGPLCGRSWSLGCNSAVGLPLPDGHLKLSSNARSDLQSQSKLYKSLLWYFTVFWSQQIDSPSPFN